MAQLASWNNIKHRLHPIGTKGLWSVRWVSILVLLKHFQDVVFWFRNSLFLLGISKRFGETFLKTFLEYSCNSQGSFRNQTYMVFGIGILKLLLVGIGHTFFFYPDPIRLVCGKYVLNQWTIFPQLNGIYYCDILNSW